MLRVHYLQHVPFEGIANIGKWVKEKGHSLNSTRLYLSEPLPHLTSFDWLVIMGGPMGVSDDAKFQWLIEEKRFIEQAILNGKTVIGVCLGAQLIADVLGARVYKNKYKEIGWFPVYTADTAKTVSAFNAFPEKFIAFHWHGDTFDLPAGAIHLVKSEGCKNQAFIYDNKVLGLQFHLEVTEASVRELIKHSAKDITGGKYVQAPNEMLSNKNYFTQIEQNLYSLLDSLYR